MHYFRQKLVSAWMAHTIFCYYSFRLLKFIMCRVLIIKTIHLHSGNNEKQFSKILIQRIQMIRGFYNYSVLMMSSAKQLKGKQIKQTQQPYRFVVVTVYLVAALVNSLPIHTFSSINSIVQKTFQISQLNVTLNALLFAIAHPIFAFPCNWILNKYGMRPGFIVGGVLVIIGVWLRILLEVGNPTYCLMGSALAAVGNIFIINTPSKVAINWFSVERVPLVTFTGILCTLISLTLGASIPGFIINSDSTPDDIRKFLFIEACIVTVPFILLIILFRERPKNPPSKAAKIIVTQERISYKILLTKLFTNKEYLKAMVAMTLNYGTLMALLTVLDQMLKGVGYTNSSQVTSTVIASAMVIGILSNLLFSFLLRKTKAYKAVSILSSLGGFYMTSLLMLFFLLKIKNTGELIFIGGITGFFLIPMPSILITYASQVVFPIDEGSSAGYLFASSQTFGFLIGLMFTQILNSTFDNSMIVAIIICGLLCLSFVTCLLIKQDLRKDRCEQSEMKLQSNLLEQSIVIFSDLK